LNGLNVEQVIDSDLVSLSVRNGLLSSPESKSEGSRQGNESRRRDRQSRDESSSTSTSHFLNSRHRVSQSISLVIESGEGVLVVGNSVRDKDDRERVDSRGVVDRSSSSDFGSADGDGRAVSKVVIVQVVQIANSAANLAGDGICSGSGKSMGEYASSEHGISSGIDVVDGENRVHSRAISERCIFDGVLSSNLRVERRISNSTGERESDQKGITGGLLERDRTISKMTGRSNSNESQQGKEYNSTGHSN